MQDFCICRNEGTGFFFLHINMEKNILAGEKWWFVSPEKNNYQDKVLLSFSGEPFTEEEMEEMLSSALDPETNAVHYRDYISMMIVDETDHLPQ